MSPKNILVRVSKLFFTQHIVQQGNEIPFFPKNDWSLEMLNFSWNGLLPWLHQKSKPNFGLFLHITTSSSYVDIAMN